MTSFCTNSTRFSSDSGGIRTKTDLEGQLPLAVEDAEEDVSEAGEGDPSVGRLHPLAAAKVDEVKPCPASHDHRRAIRRLLAVTHGHLRRRVGVVSIGFVVHRVLVHVEGEDEMRVWRVWSFALVSRAQSRVEEEGGLIKAQDLLPFLTFSALNSADKFSNELRQVTRQRKKI